MFPPPPVQGLGTIGGFKLQIEDRAGLGYEALDEATKAFMAKACKAPELAGLFSSYQVNVPQLYADIDRTKARQLGVPVTDVFDTMQIYLGSLYVNDFNQFGRTYSVRVQADAPFRARAEDVGQLKVRSDHRRDGAAVGAAEGASRAPGRSARCATTASSPADINGGAGARLFDRARRRPRSSASRPRRCRRASSFEWTELTYQEILAGNSALLVFPLAILLVFLVLAALYESLTLPLSIIMIVPMGLLAAMTGVWLTERRQQHLHPDRPDRAGRPVGQERDPDRRVRARAGIRRTHAGAGGDRSQPVAAAADPDDVARLHHGRAAAGARPPAPAPRCATRWASRCSPA